MNEYSSVLTAHLNVTKITQRKDKSSLIFIKRYLSIILRVIHKLHHDYITNLEGRDRSQTFWLASFKDTCHNYNDLKMQQNFRINLRSPSSGTCRALTCMVISGMMSAAIRGLGAGASPAASSRARLLSCERVCLRRWSLR